MFEALLPIFVLQLVNLAVLAMLFYYHRRLSFSFLKFGAATLVAEMIAISALAVGMTSATMTSFLVVGGLARVVVAMMLLATISHLIERRVPVMMMASMLVADTIAWVLVPTATGVLAGLLHELPALVLLGMALMYLPLVREQRTTGMVVLAGLIAAHLLLRVVQPMVGGLPVAAEIVFLGNGVVVTAMGIAIVMLGIEKIFLAQDDQAKQIESYEVENRRLELQFSQAQKLELLGTLAGGIAHDFNNMLTSILGYASLAMKKLDNDSEVRKDLYMVMSGARQAVDLTSQLLVYAGKGAIEFRAQDLSRIAHDLESLVKSIVPSNIQVHQQLAEGLPVLKGDKMQLGQVLVNLVANSVDAIGDEDGRIDIATGILQADDATLRTSFFGSDLGAGTFVFLRVRDTGSGIDPRQMDRIFDPFYSDKHSRKGLGLSSLSGIVRQHKGFIQVNSAPGDGAEFTVCFPVVTFSDDLADISAGALSLDRAVLMADDDPRIRSLVSAVLEGEGLHVVVAEDGNEAMARIAEGAGRFDLFVLDCTMPKLLGTEVYRQIRGRGMKQPVILISGYHQEQVIENISRDPGASFLKKPFGVDELVGRVNESLGRPAMMPGFTGEMESGRED